MPSRPTRRTLATTAASAISGVAVALSFAPYDQFWLMPLGIAGLTLTVVGQRGRGGFLQGLVFGLGFMLPLLHWVTIIGDDAWVVLALLEALFIGLMGMTWAWMRPHAWWPVGFAATWVGMEFLRAHYPVGGMPWGSLAFGLVETPVVRFGRIGGSALVAFVVVLATSLVVSAVERRKLPRVAVALGIAGIAIVAASAILPVGIADAAGSTQIAAVQGNVPGEGMDPFAERRAVLNNHAQATRDYADRVASGEAPQPDVVIWPENSTDIDPFADASAYAEIDGAVKAIGVPTLVGAVVSGPDAHHVQNMGIVWDPKSGPGEEYVKRHLVPFGEYIPFRSFFESFISRLKQIPEDMSPGDKVGVLQLGPIKVGDLMCFEVAYDGLVSSVMSGGGQVLVVQTNNATYVGTNQLAQQFAISRYRAIESGHTVVVAATDGISGIIAADGTVDQESKVKTQVVLAQEIPLADGVTLGMRIGGALKLALALLGLALAAIAYLGRRRDIGKIGTWLSKRDSSSSLPTTKQTTSSSSSIG